MAARAAASPASMSCFFFPKSYRRTPFPTPTKRQPALGNGTAYLLHDNIWNTNYPFWYPWATGDENLRFRFAVHLQ